MNDLKFAAGKFGEMIKPPEGKTRQEVWDEYMKDGGKSRGTKRSQSLCESYYGFYVTPCAKCGHEKVRGQDAVDWQDAVKV